MEITDYALGEARLFFNIEQINKQFKPRDPIAYWFGGFKECKNS